MGDIIVLADGIMISMGSIDKIRFIAHRSYIWKGGGLMLYGTAVVHYNISVPSFIFSSNLGKAMDELRDRCRSSCTRWFSGRYLKSAVFVPFFIETIKKT